MNCILLSLKFMCSSVRFYMRTMREADTTRHIGLLGRSKGDLDVHR